MPKEERSARHAVLIDADNTSAKIAGGLFEEIAKWGEASVRRIYGDFSDPHSTSWASVLAHYAIIPQQQFAYVKGKNASDITLVIDAMDLLHSGRFDGFWIVSSDSDFTRLASRIREEGVDVFGVGQKNTPESFVNACRKFVRVENLLPKSPASEVAQDAKTLEPVANAVTVLRRIIQDIDSDDGWVLLGMIGNQLANLAPDFDPRTYGYKKLSDLVRAVQAFEVASSGNALRVRVKPNATAKKSSPKAK
jgi:hypothetical protein